MVGLIQNDRYDEGMAVHFSDEALKFLRGLERHNDREWFNARKTMYETELKAPLLALIEEINAKLLGFAPEHVRPPQKAAMRIYRDVRFSPNKAPYKTNVSAWWSRSGIDKTSGAGFYMSFSPAGVVVAAGAYDPDKAQLLAIRNYLVEHSGELRGTLRTRKMKAFFPAFEGKPLTRPPKGFAEAPPDVMEWVMCRQWTVSATLPVEAALGPGLVKEVTERFRAVAPMVASLNTPLISKVRKPMF